jgi:PHP family Zn ribbon phosphoesterase
MAMHPTGEGPRPIWADLHIHTVLSPCAEVEMIPPLIVRRAQELGLGLIAVTDHNAAENVAAVQAAAVGSGIAVLPGMEVQTREEAHVLCLFDVVEQVLAFQELIYASLPALSNRADIFGEQYVVDETGDFVRLNERLLLVSSALSVTEIVAAANERGGCAIAAHVDRQAFSLLGNLGFIPDDLALSAVEISRATAPETAVTRFPLLRGWPLITSGDAHRLAEMRASTLITMAQPSIRELRLAFRSQDGRKVKLLP